MYLDVKVRLSNKFWARHLADTVLMWLKCNSTPLFGVDSRLPAVVIATPMTLQAGYAASRISSKLKGSTKQFGWLQAPRNQSSIHRPGTGARSFFAVAAF